MPAFKIHNNKAIKIKQKEFKNELELHKLVDNNLEEIFGLKYIKDEHITDKHGRIETLAIDESNRPAVIEYKKSKETGQLTQANRYMTWIKQNPDSFELLVRKILKNSVVTLIFLIREYYVLHKNTQLMINALPYHLVPNYGNIGIMKITP